MAPKSSAVKRKQQRGQQKVAKVAPVDDFLFTINSDRRRRKKEKEIQKVIKTNSKKAKKAKKNAAENNDEDNLASKDLNPEFRFQLDDDISSYSNFDGWDFQVDDKQQSSSTGVVSTDVDLDSIIRRKGGLAQVANVGVTDSLSAAEEDEDDDEDEETNESGEDEDEDELAMDGFGMGITASDKKDHEEEESEEESEEEGKQNGEEELVEEELKLSNKDKRDKQEEAESEDTVEEMAQFYASDSETPGYEKLVHKSFQTLSLSRPVLKGLAQLGYTRPTPIQSASIPISLLGKDIVAGAVTGSGKTAAYMIPIIERLLYKPTKIPATRVIVLAPTRELAIQVCDVGKKIGQFVNGLTFGLAVGGLNLRQQEQELKSRPDIVIATPGRFIDHIRNSPSFNVDSVEVLVFDEADRMLEEGFQSELTEILSLLPTKRQTSLFSATMNSKIKSLIQLGLNKPVRIMIDPPKQAATGLVQEFVRIRKRESLKPAVLFNILKKIDSKQQNRIVVFVSRKEMAHKLRIILGLLGIKVAELHGSLSQEQRLKSITDFKNLKVPVLICTDLASRGLDIPKIEFVLNYDMPKNFEIYLHRVGRTARAGREGRSISFVGEKSQDRAIVKDAIKSVESNKSGKAVGRNVDWKEVEEINKILEAKKDIIEEILIEEKQEKEILQAEMELKKGENLLKYKDEIASRPKRTWFQTEAEKKINNPLLM
ncbi:hypothetical protein PACTADRAFT_49490, partial [Pachysolen tannophilus NRRL Y-2460]